MSAPGQHGPHDDDGDRLSADSGNTHAPSASTVSREDPYGTSPERAGWFAKLGWGIAFVVACGFGLFVLFGPNNTPVHRFLGIDYSQECYEAPCPDDLKAAFEAQEDRDPTVSGGSGAPVAPPAPATGPSPEELAAAQAELDALAAAFGSAWFDKLSAAVTFYCRHVDSGARIDPAQSHVAAATYNENWRYDTDLRWPQSFSAAVRDACAYG